AGHSDPGGAAGRRGPLPVRGQARRPRPGRRRPGPVPRRAAPGLRQRADEVVRGAPMLQGDHRRVRVDGVGGVVVEPDPTGGQVAEPVLAGRQGDRDAAHSVAPGEKPVGAGGPVVEATDNADLAGRLVEREGEDDPGLRAEQTNSLDHLGSLEADAPRMSRVGPRAWLRHAGRPRFGAFSSRAPTGVVRYRYRPGGPGTPSGPSPAPTASGAPRCPGGRRTRRPPAPRSRGCRACGGWSRPRGGPRRRPAAVSTAGSRRTEPLLAPPRMSWASRTSTRSALLLPT